MSTINNEEWAEFSLQEYFDLGDPPKYPKKIKLLADQNIPMHMIQDLAKSFSIKSVFDLSLDGHPDENIREASKKQKRILLTTDKDFWDEKKHPIKKCSGVICTEAGPGEIDKIYMSLAKFYMYLVKKYPNHWWHYTKAFIKTNGFVLRTIQSHGVIVDTECLYSNGRVIFKIAK